MAINFPDAPAVDQVYTDPTCGSSWRWDGITWNGEVEETDLGPIVSLLERNLDLYVATTGNDTTGDGTQALPWATPHRAMAYLSRVIIADGVTATVNVADGQYTFTTPLNLIHPNGNQILITGTSTTGTRPTTGLNGGAVIGNTAATRAYNLPLLQGYYNTRWKFNTCDGLVAEYGSAAKVNLVLIEGTGTVAAAGIRAYASTLAVGDKVSIHDFGSVGVSVGGATVNIDAITVTNCQDYGVLGQNGAQISARSCFIQNTSGVGIAAGVGSSIEFESSYARYCSSSGVGATNGSCVRATAAICDWNGGEGISASNGSTIYASGAFARRNGGQGLNASKFSVIDFPTGTASSNTGVGVRATSMAHIIITGATVSGNTAAQYSPALNTNGNSNSYING